jgi:transglutaminase-like putative cysteine protease
MVRLKFDIELKYEVAEQASDFILNIHAAHTACQTVVSESIHLSPSAPHTIFTDSDLGNRYLRLQAQAGELTVNYEATVDIAHYRESPIRLEEVSIAALPAEVFPYLYPSRYCQSDRLHKLASAEFGALRQGYWRVVAIQDWVRKRTSFMPGSSNASTSALDTIVGQVGVCRDFAHLMIALCRAVNIPARFVTGIDFGAPPELGPTDFHAYVEVFLTDRWYLFDPSGFCPTMGLVRLGTGRDAADVSVATIFGPVRSFPPAIRINAIDDPTAGKTLPWRPNEALSTYSGRQRKTDSTYFRPRVFGSVSA